MSYALLLFIAAWILIGCFALYLVLFRYAHRGSIRWYTILPVFSGWFLTFSTVFLVPLDLTLAKYEACIGGDAEDLVRGIGFGCVPPWFYHDVGPTVFLWLWRLIYWNSFCSTWFILPMLSAYYASGHWKALAKLKDAARRNAIWYGLYAALGVVAVIVLWRRGEVRSWHGLLDLSMAASNAYGLFMVTAFLSVGLIALPRRYWRMSDPAEYLSDLYQSCLRRKEEWTDNLLELEECFEKLEKMASKIPNDEPELHEQVEQLRALRPIQLRNMMIEDEESPPQKPKDAAGRSHKRGVYSISSLLSLGGVSKPKRFDREAVAGKLVQLHLRLIYLLRYRLRCEGRWRNTFHKTCELEDRIDRWSIHKQPLPVSDQASSAMEIFLMTSNSHARSNATLPKGALANIVRFFHARVIPATNRVVAVCLAILSLSIIWSEISLIVPHYNLSLIHVFSKLLVTVPFTFEILVFICLLYMAFCTFSSLLSWKFFSMYKLVAGRWTDLGSLLFFSGYLCRLSFSLTYNYLMMLSGGELTASSFVSRTAFIQLMGRVDLVPLLGHTYMRYYLPVMLVILLGLVFMRLDRAVLRVLGLQAYFYAEAPEGRAKAELVLEGKHLVAYERSLHRHSTVSKYPHEPGAAAKGFGLRANVFQDATGSSSSDDDDGRRSDPFLQQRPLRPNL